MAVYIRTLQKQGTSVVVPIPSEFRKYGFTIGNKVDMREEDGDIILSIRDDEKQQLCPHCNGLRMCRCPDCASAGRTIVRRPVLIAVKCHQCNGTGKINVTGGE